MGPTRKERGENIARLRKQQILDASIEVFSQKGFAMATTAEIARNAGISEGTIYKYFPTKRELFISVIQNFIITAPLLDLIDKLPNGDISTTFGQILNNRLKLLESEFVPHIVTFMAEIQRDPELKALWLKQFLQPFMTKMEEIYRGLTASRIYRDLEPSVAVRAIGGMILGFLILKMMEGDNSPLDRLPREKITASLINFALHGLLGEKGK